MIQKVLLLFGVVFSLNLLAESKEYLPDMLSPKQLSQELGLKPTVYDAAYSVNVETTGLTRWNQRSGIDLTQYFDVVIVVNKAASGATAQHASVYYQGKFFKSYLVSTGREQYEEPPSGEEYYSTTPEGFYSPEYLDEDHYSDTWEAPMPFAVFFNGGIAIHATTSSHYEDLGNRASGGCVRMTYDNAHEVFNLVERAGSGHVPQFTRGGSLVKNAQGQIQFQNNYKTLIIVENYKD